MKTKTIYDRLHSMHRLLFREWLTTRGFPTYMKSERPPETEFHTKTMVCAGHWRYMGHDIKRDPVTKKWNIGYKRGCPYVDDGFWKPQRTLEGWCSIFLDEYVMLLSKVNDIERERRGH